MENSKLLDLARIASQKAYCPYSGFAVGAAAELSTGEVVTGSNQECASYSLTICAERVALAAAFAADDKCKVVKIAIYSKRGKSITPCGACREYIMECARRSDFDIEVITELFAEPISALLPHPFTL